MIFRRFPYTTINDINLDWIIKRIKELGADVASYAADIANALAQAEAAQEAAESVTGTAAQALTTAQAAETTANNIAGTAAQALTTAQAAETTANNIAGTAEQALSTAQAAETTAQAAETTAQAAETTAQAAESTAQDARTIASQATATASNAEQTANTALSTADAASVVALDARETANTAQQTANTAQQTASTAQQTASTALSLADAASVMAKEALDSKAGALIDTNSGPVVTFLSDSTIQDVKNVSVAVVPVQAGSGVPSPDNVRPISGWDTVDVNMTGKNFLPNGTQSIITNGITFTKNVDGSISIFGTASGIAFFTLCNGDVTLPAGNYALSGGQSSEVLVAVRRGSNTGTNIAQSMAPGDRSFSLSNNTVIGAVIRVASGATVNTTLYPMVRLAIDGDATFAPYAGSIYNIQPGQTIYGGTLDVTVGKMYARPYFPSYNGQTLIGPWISSMDVYTPGATPTVGAQVVDMGGAVTEITFDPVNISAISGQLNNIWSPAGDVSVEYATDLKWYIDNKLVELQALVLENGG